MDIYFNQFFPFILNNLNISTINIGENINAITSKILFIGNVGILNIFLNAGMNNIISINAADNAIAPSNILLFNKFPLNTDL